MSILVGDDNDDPRPAEVSTNGIKGNYKDFTNAFYKIITAKKYTYKEAYTEICIPMSLHLQIYTIMYGKTQAFIQT